MDFTQRVVPQAGRIHATQRRTLRQQRPLVAGVWHRGYFSEDTRDALIVLLGIETETMRFGYSYDITISQLTPATGGTHEITLAMRFASPYDPNSEQSPARRSDDLFLHIY